MQQSKRSHRSRRRNLSVALVATLLMGGASACGDEQVPGGALGQDTDPNNPAPGGDGDGNGQPSGGGGGENPDDSPPITVKSKWCDALAALRTNCQQCHSASVNSPAPMPLDTYEDLMQPAVTDPDRKVYELVGERIHDEKRPMPEPPLVMSDTDKAAIDAWIADGAQPGPNAACGSVSTPDVDPDPDTETPVEEDWPEDCEEVYSLRTGSNGQPHIVRAGSETHPQFYFDAPWGDDPVQAVAFKPITDNAKVIHHWILYENGGGGAAGIGGSFLTGWSPGKEGIRGFPEDIGVYMPSGSDVLRLDTHYYNLGGTQDEQDQSGLDICITRNFREHTAATHAFGSFSINLAPGDNEDVVANCTVSTTGGSAYLLASSPHMHKLGYWAKLSHTRDGVETMLHDQSFNFEFQDVKRLDRVELKDGDRMTTVCSFENTTNGTVRFGQNTDDEMCFNFALYYPRGALRCGFF